MRRRRNCQQGSETAFLKKRRECVSIATEASKGATAPSWMKSLSSKLWSARHVKEDSFNHNKFRKKQLLAFEAGNYVPRNGAEKRKLEEAVLERQEQEKKHARHGKKALPSAPKLQFIGALVTETFFLDLLRRSCCQQLLGLNFQAVGMCSETSTSYIRWFQSPAFRRDAGLCAEVHSQAEAV